LLIGCWEGESFRVLLSRACLFTVACCHVLGEVDFELESSCHWLEELAASVPVYPWKAHFKPLSVESKKATQALCCLSNLCPGVSIHSQF
jgi:hypothetical protein